MEKLQSQEKKLPVELVYFIQVCVCVCLIILRPGYVNMFTEPYQLLNHKYNLNTNMKSSSHSFSCFYDLDCGALNIT